MTAWEMKWEHLLGRYAVVCVSTHVTVNRFFDKQRAEKSAEFHSNNPAIVPSRREKFIVVDNNDK